jgi:hypothetical protein
VIQAHTQARSLSLSRWTSTSRSRQRPWSSHTLTRPNRRWRSDGTPPTARGTGHGVHGPVDRRARARISRSPSQTRTLPAGRASLHATVESYRAP